MYDVCIIGAGVVGCFIARELSKYDLNICLLEKEEDVSCGASKANSGIVHGGYAAKYGTLKGELCNKGNKMFKKLNEELNFGYRQTGGLVIGFNDEDADEIKKLYENGIKIGCDDIEIITKDKILEIEPNINKDVKVALYSKNIGVASPYELVIALAENAVENGIDLRLETEVLNINKIDDYFEVFTNKEIFKSKYIINAAGVYSDKIAKMIGIDDFYIIPRKGQYILLDKDQGNLVNTVIFQVPTAAGKGILVTSTYHKNLIIGPNAEEMDNKEDVSTTEEKLKYIIKTARISVPNFNLNRSLTSFSGIRATSNTNDFIIEESRINNFINVAGIDSPGLTSSPAIAERVIDIFLKIGLDLKEKHYFNPYRKSIIIKKDKNFDGIIDSSDPNKNIICRCEKVTEAEIIDSLNRGIKISTIDSVKRRTRAGMGMCQGGFCKSRVKSLISKHLNIPLEKVRQRGKDSNELIKVDIKKLKE